MYWRNTCFVIHTHTVLADSCQSTALAYMKDWVSVLGTFFKVIDQYNPVPPSTVKWFFHFITLCIWVFPRLFSCSQSLQLFFDIMWRVSDNSFGLMLFCVFFFFQVFLLSNVLELKRSSTCCRRWCTATASVWWRRRCLSPASRQHTLLQVHTHTHTWHTLLQVLNRVQEAVFPKFHILSLKIGKV